MIQNRQRGKVHSGKALPFGKQIKDTGRTAGNVRAPRFPDQGKLSSQNNPERQGTGDQTGSRALTKTCRQLLLVVSEVSEAWQAGPRKGNHL